MQQRSVKSRRHWNGALLEPNFEYIFRVIEQKFAFLWIIQFFVRQKFMQDFLFIKQNVTPVHRRI